jgi:trans-aconitate methyltransferase
VNDRAQAFWLKHLQAASHYNRWIVSQVLPYVGQDSLEIGCGTGNLTELLAQTGVNLTAVDVDAAFVQQAKMRLQPYANVTISVADATQMPWTRSFDTIILLDVLEHIEQDHQLLRQLQHGLKPGGRLVVKVPALNWLYSPLDRAIGHYRRYSKRTLAATLKQAEFSSSTIWYFNAAGIPGWWLNGKLLQRTVPPAEQIGWFDRLVPLLQTVESLGKMPIGLSLFAVAEKPSL